MRKITLLLAGGLISTMSLAQTSWSENFDSYSVGDYMGVVGAANGWTTWSGSGAGTSEDVQVSDAQALSPANSIEFIGGIGQDVVIDFGDEYNEGHFVLDLSIYADSGFYFNFQGNSAIGTTFPLQMYVIDDTIGVDDANFLYVNQEFTDENNWVTITFDIDLDNNVWTVLWDGDSLASFENAEINQVAGMDFYPLDETQDWFIDDISWTWTPSPRDVTFSVDMTYYEGDFTTVYASGNALNNWCGNCNPLQDDDGDGVWEATYAVAADSMEWKYQVDDWSDDEIFTEGMPCTKTSFGFTNRFVVFDGASGSAVTLPTYCWEQCDTCSLPTGIEAIANAAPSIYPNPTNDVINIDFSSEVKDMTISVYDLTGREVVRAFNNFNGTKAIVDVTSLPQGAYTVVGSSDDLRFTESVIIAQ